MRYPGLRASLAFSGARAREFRKTLLRVHASLLERCGELVDATRAHRRTRCVHSARIDPEGDEGRPGESECGARSHC